MVQKIVQKMVQGSNGPILILPYAILLHALQVILVWLFEHLSLVTFEISHYFFPY